MKSFDTLLQASSLSRFKEHSNQRIPFTNIRGEKEMKLLIKKAFSPPGEPKPNMQHDSIFSASVRIIFTMLESFPCACIKMLMYPMPTSTGEGDRRHLALPCRAKSRDPSQSWASKIVLLHASLEAG